MLTTVAAVTATVGRFIVRQHHICSLMNEFAAAYSALTHIAGIAKGLFQTHAQVKINDVAIELQGAILDLQAKLSGIHSQYQEMLKAKENTEKKLVAYEQWERESARYAMKEMAPGTVAYALKPDCAAGEPTHWLCPTCYKNRQASILHPDSKGSSV
jgi:hypothetical protein